MGVDGSTATVSGTSLSPAEIFSVVLGTPGDEAANLESHLPEILGRFEHGSTAVHQNLEQITDLLALTEARAQEMADRNWFKQIWHKITGQEARDRDLIRGHLVRVQATGVVVMERLLQRQEYLQDGLAYVQRRLEATAIDNLRLRLVAYAVLGHHGRCIENLDRRLQEVEKRLGMEPGAVPSGADSIPVVIDRIRCLPAPPARAEDVDDSCGEASESDYEAAFGPGTGGVQASRPRPVATGPTVIDEVEDGIVVSPESGSTHMELVNGTDLPIRAQVKFAFFHIASVVIPPRGVGHLRCERVWYDLRAFTASPDKTELAEYPSPAYGSGRFVFKRHSGTYRIEKAGD